MNITALRPRVITYLEPVAVLFCKAGITPNQISLLSLVAGIGTAYLYYRQDFLAGSLLLLLSAGLDLIDGTVARKTNKKTDFGAVFDWIVDKYVDALVLLGIGFSGVAIVSSISPLPPIADFGVVGLAITGSLMNTFIKPVVYAEIGYSERKDGKIDDPLEGVGFFGRPETLLVLVIGGITGYIWIAVILIALCTNL
ncbi:MAG: CDP-alcohol phosphatidyltransferase family protein, partial [Methanoregulaceae archaeon]|nr:CDP-alcohol phosphatidyltransferase family protein [Methanoregulaceae archaeon]